MQPDEDSEALLPASADRAFEVLREALERHERELQDTAQAFVLSLRITTDHRAAQQIAREVFQRAASKALERASAFEPSRPALPWLRTVIFNEARTLRKEGEADSRLLLYVSDGRQADDENDDALLERLFYERGLNETEGAALEDIGPVLDRLTPDEQAVLTASLDGYTGEALAAKLSAQLGKTISRGAADTRLCRARTRFAAEYRALYER